MPRRRWLPGAVWPVVVVHGLLLVVTSVLYPTYRGPDETAHVDLVLAVMSGGYPALEGSELSERAVRTRDLVGLPRQPGSSSPPLRAREAPPRAERPPFATAGPDEPSGIPQQLSMHPPLYYEAAAGALRAATGVSTRAAWSFDQVVGFLRLVSAVLVLPLPLLAALAARLLTDRADVVVTAALVPLGVPMLTHVGAAVTNDALLVLLVGVVTVLGVVVARGDTRSGVALGVGVLGGLALLTKGFALAVLPWIAVAYGLAALRGAPRRAVGAGALALGTAGLVGGWWWLRNVLRFGTLQPSGVEAGPAPSGFAPDVGAWATFFVGRLSEQFWVEPDIVPDGAIRLDLVASLVVIAVVVVAVVAAHHVAVDRAKLGLLALLPLAVGSIVVFGAWRAYVRTSETLAIHGRYLYAGLVAVAPLVAVGLAAVARLVARAWRQAGGRAATAGGPPPRSWLPIAVATIVAASQLTAGLFALARYWGPTDAPEPRADAAAMLAWSPWPPAFPVLAVVALVAAAVWLGTSLAHSNPRDPCQLATPSVGQPAGEGGAGTQPARSAGGFAPCSVLSRRRR